MSATILDTFYCREVSEGGMRLLMADYSVVCYDEGGGVNRGYLAYLIVAALLCLVWSLGVPVRRRARVRPPPRSARRPLIPPLCVGRARARS